MGIHWMLNDPPTKFPFLLTSMQPAKCLFVAGTDTDVGKTYVSCMLLKRLASEQVRVGAYKPVASGFPTVEGSDGQRLMHAIGQSDSIDQVSPQRFLAPLAPPVAAKMEGRVVDEQSILSGFHEWRSRTDFLLVEGAGGLMSPVSDRWTNADLIQALDVPILLVSNWRLGVVNQVLTTLVACDALHIRVQAIVLNDVQNEGATRSHFQLLADFLTGKKRWQTIPVLLVKHGEATIESAVSLDVLFS
jgi:dethiobiotin synthetase